jgi:hypothetical protein
LHHHCLSIGITAKGYIAQALPNAEVGGIESISRQEVLIEVEQSLKYSGDESSGPKLMALNSRRFEELLGAVLLCLEKILVDATIVMSFWLKDGHPDYPVFWNFAFIFV